MFYAQLEAVMNGEAEVDTVSDSTLSFQIYLKAAKILGMDRIYRTMEVDDLPTTIRELVRAEIIRLHALRRLKPKPAMKVQYEKAVHRPEWADFV